MDRVKCEVWVPRGVAYPKGGSETSDLLLNGPCEICGLGKTSQLTPWGVIKFEVLLRGIEFHDRGAVLNLRSGCQEAWQVSGVGRIAY